MNATADDIYRELITLPENKLAEVRQFVEFMKHKMTQSDSTTVHTPLTIKQAQQLVVQKIPTKYDLVEELIAERRAEAKYE